MPSNTEETNEASCNDVMQETEILHVDPLKIGRITFDGAEKSHLGGWQVHLNKDSGDANNLRRAAIELQTTDVPVAFPTETVYGLGADATRSSAVRGIYRAKNRPADNPLIVHVASLQQLRRLLRPLKYEARSTTNGYASSGSLSYSNVNDDDLLPANVDPIPEIYQPLIKRFWPGPLTLIMPNPQNSVLAPEVTAGLETFGVRMPNSLLALVLIKLSNLPLAAPSANASTKPSPTTAEHVQNDLNGRIRTILDGGPCTVGVESTVVDGLSSPPLILRPGGIGIDELRKCPGWQDVEIGYKDLSETGQKPKAPGMKYRHYSPKAKVVLYEHQSLPPSLDGLHDFLGSNRVLGVIRTRKWQSAEALQDSMSNGAVSNGKTHEASQKRCKKTLAVDANGALDLPFGISAFEVNSQSVAPITILEINLGANVETIARGLFSALRDLDKRNVDAIVVEGIDDGSGDTAAAVMNRLRKASEVKIRPEDT